MRPAILHLARDGGVIAVLVALPLIGPWLPRRGDVSATVKMGPNTGGYLDGFVPRYEIAGLQATRFTTYDATVDLPLSVRGGPARLAWRAARMYPQTAVVDVSMAGRQLDHYTCRGGLFATRVVDLPALPSTPAVVRFQVDSHERLNRGLRLDWLQVAAGRGARLVPRGPAAALVPALLAGLFLLFRWVGLGTGLAALATVPWAAGAAAWAAADPFAYLHVGARVALPCLVLAGIAALVLRRVTWGEWALVALVASFLLKGIGLMHPASFYPDIQNGRRFAQALAETGGPLPERTVAAQKAINVGYPRTIAGRQWAMPYSPLPYMPLAALPTDQLAEDAFRLSGLVPAALETLAVFALARLLVADPLAAALSALFSVVSPPLFSRLLLAMEATLIGHVFDAALVAALVWLARSPRSPERIALVAFLALSSLLLYVSSLFTVGTLLVIASLLDRRLAPPLLSILAMGALVTAGWLYLPFTRAFFTELLPALLQGAEAGSASATPETGSPVLGALRRIPLFYGIGVPLLAAGGFLHLRRTTDPPGLRVLTAYALAFALLVGLRAFGGNLFRDLKEITFVSPLLAVTTGALLAALARRGRSGAVAAGIVAAGLVLFGLGQYRFYLAEYASPFLVAHDLPALR